MMRRWTAVIVGVCLSCAVGLAQQGNPASGTAGAAGGNAGVPAVPSPLTGTPNPYLAQAVVRTLQESGKLAHYRIHVNAQDGVVELRGDVTDENQREVVLRLLRTVPGITLLRDFMQVRPERIPPPQYQLPPALVLQAQAAIPNPPPLPNAPPAGVKVAPERIDGQQLEPPLPIFQAPLPGQVPGQVPNPTLQPPPLPPYAWPTVAPYNNYSRVAYPTSYPYEQWPFIGPMYPFPRVPMGWRSVSLTWEDGTWWFYRNPSGHDWWRVRYR